MEPDPANPAATLLGLLARRAEGAPNGPALAAPGRTPMRSAALARLVFGVHAALRERGIGSDGRVALVVSNGPEAAAAFLGIASAAGCAPLNPVYREREIEFALDDLGVDALVVEERSGSPAARIAEARGVPVLRLESLAAEAAGSFLLDGSEPAADAPTEAADLERIALLLHTSGTTSRPKLVPLAERNLLVSARNVAHTLRLAPEDVCLNVMPLFHIHGLVAAVLASLHGGGSVFCTPGFDGSQAPAWLASGVTWMTAVPTVYQSLVHLARERPDALAGHTLRFVRSSSAALPVPVLTELERALGVPVVEAYGMTEAAHQMASNPLPPARRVPGSVGPAAGPEVTILDPDGAELPRGALGEVAIRGANVFAGYEANPEANAEAFSGGWFRTGDEGVLDEDGYLHLRGRLKEIINRGGEKISPREVDDVLAAHPAVRQVVTFAMPDARLGEEVAAAVVLAQPAAATERELQDFAVHSLAPFKVPRRILMVDEIPKGATGKLQRIGLADMLGLTGEPAPAAPGSRHAVMLEFELRRAWSTVLGRDDVGLHDDFFALGGDSLRGAELVARIRDLCGRPDLPLISIVRAPTVAAMVSELLEGVPEPGGHLVPFGADDGQAVFLVHGVLGDVVGFAALGARMPAGYRLVGVRAQDDDHAETVQEMASVYLADCREVQPTGPYVVGGMCMGAAVAIEMVRKLEEAGEDARLLLIDPRLPPPHDVVSLAWRVLRRLQRGDLRSAIRRHAPGPLRFEQRYDTPTWSRLDHARNTYSAAPVRTRASIVSSVDHVRGEWGIPPFWWRRILRGLRSQLRVSGSHETLFHAQHADETAAAVTSALKDLR